MEVEILGQVGIAVDVFFHRGVFAQLFADDHFVVNDVELSLRIVPQRGATEEVIDDRTISRKPRLPLPLEDRIKEVCFGFIVACLVQSQFRHDAIKSAGQFLSQGHIGPAQFFRQFLPAAPPSRAVRRDNAPVRPAVRELFARSHRTAACSLGLEAWAGTAAVSLVDARLTADVPPLGPHPVDLVGQLVAQVIVVSKFSSCSGESTSYWPRAVRTKNVARTD